MVNQYRAVQDPERAGAISVRCGARRLALISDFDDALTVTDLNNFMGRAQTTNLGGRSSNLFGRAILPPLR